MTLSISCPFLKIIMQGIPLTSNWAAISWLSSTFSFVNFSLLVYSFDNFSKTGPTILQGPHQGAQKSTRTGNLFFRTSFSKVDLSTSSIFTCDIIDYYLNF